MWRLKIKDCVLLGLLLLLETYSIEAHLRVVTDPDGTSLRQDEASAENRKSDGSSHFTHKATDLLAHEVARQLLAERRIAKLKAHLEQAEVNFVLYSVSS